MSLGIVIKGPEGLVLAAESRLTLTATPPNAPPLHVGFDNATKVFGFGAPNSAVGVVTYGAGAIGLRSAYSLVPEFEAQLPAEQLAVAEFADNLSAFYLQQWQNIVGPNHQGPGMTFVVAGFNEAEAYGRVFLIEVPNAPQRQERSPGTEFGITWGGQQEIVTRLVMGYDPRVLPAVQSALGLNFTPQQTADLQAALQLLAMQMPLPAMSLQDCVDLAIFFVKTTIEAQRLSVGVRGCGGPIDIAVVTRQGGLSFVQQKKVRGETTTV